MGKETVFPGHAPGDQQKMLVKHPKIIVDIPPGFREKLPGPNDFLRQDIGNGGIGVEKSLVRTEDIKPKGSDSGGKE